MISFMRLREGLFEVPPVLKLMGWPAKVGNVGVVTSTRKSTPNWRSAVMPEASL